MKQRTLDQLMRLECYAYTRYTRSLLPFWKRLTIACNRAVKAHPDYKGV